MKSAPYGKFYHSLTAILLVALYGAYLFKSYAPYVDYAVNYQYISKVLCENKEKVGSCCKGKCHLDKELKKSAEKESSPQTAAQTRILQQEIFTEITTIELNQFLQNTETSVPAYAANMLSAVKSILSPPPRVV